MQYLPVIGWDDARQRLDKVRSMADLVIRGDEPYSFTAGELEAAMSDALATFDFLYSRLIKFDVVVEHHGALKLSYAIQYARSLATNLRSHPDATSYQIDIAERVMISVSVRSEEILQPKNERQSRPPRFSCVRQTT